MRERHDDTKCDIELFYFTPKKNACLHTHYFVGEEQLSTFAFCDVRVVVRAKSTYVSLQEITLAEVADNFSPPIRMLEGVGGGTGRGRQRGHKAGLRRGGILPSLRAYGFVVKLQRLIILPHVAGDTITLDESLRAKDRACRVRREKQSTTV